MNVSPQLRSPSEDPCIGALDFRSWMRMHFSAAPRHFASCYQIFDSIGEQVVGQRVLMTQNVRATGL